MRKIATLIGIAYVTLLWADVGVLPDGDRYVKGQVLVGLAEGTKLPKPGATALGGTVVRSYPNIHTLLLRFPTDRAITPLLRSITANPGVRYAEPDRIYRAAAFEPSDPNFNYQWGVKGIYTQWLWDLSKGGPNVLIAILDSGVNYNHPDLAGHYAGGYDFLDNDSNPMDVDGHGTSVAGVAAAVTNNDVGIAGVGFDCRFLAVRVGTNNVYPESNIVSGINWAVSNGAHVINLSIGGYGHSAAIEAATTSAFNNGVVVCAAAGNDATTQPFYPAADPYCIGVAATGTNTGLASFTNRGAWVKMAAPGTGIITTLPGNDYGYRNGSSMASPIAAGTAALLYDLLGGSRTLNNAQTIMAAMLYTATSFTGEIGGGRLNAYKSGLILGHVPPSWIQNITQSGWGNLNNAEIVQDGANNVYTGYLVSTGGQQNFEQGLVKYNSEGAVIWKTATPVFDSSYYPRAMAVSGGYLWVANDGFSVRRYNVADGADAGKWTLPNPSSTESPDDMVVDGNGDLVIMGVRGGPDWLLRLGKIGANGGVIWEADHSTTQEPDPCFIKTDAQMNIYILGTRGLSDSMDVLLQKFSSTNGAAVWERVLAGSGNLSDEEDGLDVSPAGNRIAVTGVFQENGTRVRKLFIYDTGGTVVWSKTIGVAAPAFEYHGGVSFDPSGNVVLFTTEPNPTTGKTTVRVLKYDGNGNLIWNSPWTLPDDVPGFAQGTRPQFDSDGNVFVTGFFYFNFIGSDSITLKLDPTGKVLWAGRYPGSASSSIGDLMVVTPDGTAVVGGKSQPQFGDPSNSTLGYRIPGAGNTATGNVAGTISLDQYSGSGELSGVIEFREPGTSNVLVSAPVMVGSTSTYDASAVPQGVYDVSIKVANWLRKTAKDVAVVDGTISQNFTLMNGDADGSNQVDVFDLNRLLVHFGQAVTDGDLDWDGWVTIFDLNPLLINFSKAGDL